MVDSNVKTRHKLDNHRIYLKIIWIRKFNQVILGTVFLLFISIIVFAIFSNPTLIFWPDSLLSLLFWVLMGLIIYYSFTIDPMSYIQNGFVIIVNLLFIIMIFIMAIFPWYSFAKILPIIYIISLILFLILCIGAILMMIANIFCILLKYKNKKKESEISKIIQNKRLKTILLISVIVIGIPFAILSIPGVLQISIEIKPKDYQAEIAFWGGYELNDSKICSELNEHKVTLIQCCYDDIYDQDGKQNFIKNMAFYNKTYPNISIFLSVNAEPGAFVWDGNTENIVQHAKNLVNLIQEYNLKNIKGLAFDIEGPYYPYFGYIPDYDCSPDKERHDKSIDLWYDFFNWMEKNAPELELNAINYVESGIDLFDKDYDLHYIRRYSFLDLNTNAIDEYASMSYRCMYMGRKPYGDSMENPIVNYIDGGHYWFYTQLRLFSEALDNKFGNHEKMGVYLGITNCTCYGSKNIQYKNGKPAGYGFDSLVRDALIAKHFGIKRITIFLLNTVLENGYSMGGVFDSYGKDFLDRFNESINGKDSIKSFKIWYKPRFNYILTFGHVDHFFYDFYANLNSLWGIFYVFLIFILNYSAAYLNWRKVKNNLSIKNIDRIHRSL
ncbi:MAG: hypothetical protein ACTSQP_14140 [Promethearchaeota archaeon]